MSDGFTGTGLSYQLFWRLYWLDFVVILIQPRVTWEEGASAEKLTRPDRHLAMPVRETALIDYWCRKAQPIPRQVVLGWITRGRKSYQRAFLHGFLIQLLLEFLPCLTSFGDKLWPGSIRWNKLLLGSVYHNRKLTRIETSVGGLQNQGLPGLQNEFKFILGVLTKSCLKRKRGLGFGPVVGALALHVWAPRDNSYYRKGKV